MPNYPAIYFHEGRSDDSVFMKLTADYNDQKEEFYTFERQHVSKYIPSGFEKHFDKVYKLPSESDRETL